MKRLFVRAGAAVVTCAALIAAPLVAIPALAATNVGDEAGLRAAIAAGDDVTLTGNITLTSPIVVPGTFSGTINGAGNTITANMGDPDDPETDKHKGMFITNGDVTLDNVTVDGGQKWRTFWVATGTLTLQNNTTLTKGRANKYLGDGGAVMLRDNTKLVVNDSKITESHGFVAQSPDGGIGNGGAVSSRPGVTIEGANCTFENNHTSGHGGSNGGAIFLSNDSRSNDSRLTLNSCTFTGNSAVNVGGPGRQGGAIYMSDAVANITDSTFNIAHGFNTGGAIRALHGELDIRRSTFTIGALGDGFGISGGALAVGSTKTLIEDSTFTSTDPSSKVTHAGGFITVVGPQPAGVGEGEYGLTVRNSTFTGNGSWWNGPSTATYGGGITFEGGPSVSTTYTALIEGTRFSNMAADENGGAISIGTKKGEAGGATTVTLRNSSIEGTRTRFAWKDTVGGGIYVGPGHTLIVDGASRINNNFAVRGGGIFNMGTTTLTGGTTLAGNTTYQIGGGVYNDGVLTVDEATLANNRNAEGRKYPGKNAPEEYVGGNIYAKKDVTITPNATLDANDVRVLDAESAIILTGTLTKQINVSVSEKPGGSYPETQNRYIGYTVAKGNGTYEPNAEDAKQLHYVTYNGTQPVAEFADHESIGKWDYVWNPTAKTVVLGQRAKMVYHSNQGTFDATQCAGATFDTPKNETKDQLYWVYSSAPGAYTIDPDDKAATSLVPMGSAVCRGDAKFLNWYKVDGPHAGNKNTVAAEALFDFTQFFGAENAKQDGKIIDILNKNEFHAYAGWKANVEATYEYKSAHADDPAAPAFPQALKDKAPAFDRTEEKGNAPQIGSDVAAVNPNPTTEEQDGYKWVFTKWQRNNADVADTSVTNIQEAHHFVGLWKVQLTKTHEFVSGTAGKVLPAEVTALTPAAGPWQEFDTTMTPTAPKQTTVDVTEGTWKFQSWDKTEVPNAKANQHFIGTWVFEELPKVPVTFTVENCQWADGGTDPITKQITVTRAGNGVTGKLGDVIPTGMQAAAGYEGGAWKAPAPTPGTDITEPVTFTYSCEKLLKATHEFQAKDTTEPLPAQITNGVPADFDFARNSDVTPGEFTNNLTKANVEVANGTWSWAGWDEDSVPNATTNQHFIGYWTFKNLDPYTVTYKVVNCQWQDGSTADKETSVTVTRDMATGQRTGNLDGSTIPTEMRPRDGFEGGAWDTVPTANMVITEPRVFTYTCNRIMLQATHEFRSGTQGKELPQQIVDGTPDAYSFPWGKDIIQPGDFKNNLERALRVEDGTWTFQSWAPESYAEPKENKHFIGTWLFTPYTPGKATFKVVNCQWDDNSVADKLVDVPTKLVGDREVALLKAEHIPTGMTPLEGFTGGAWAVPAPAADLEIPKEGTSFTYTCDRIMLQATHEFKSGTPGKDLTDQIKAGVPADYTFPWGADKIVPGQFQNGLPTVIKLPDGTWEFKRWEPASYATPKENKHFVGVWEFTPIDPVTVTYKVVNCQWEDGSKDDKTVTIDRKRVGNVIVGLLGDTVPAGMKPAPGYVGGKWDTVPTATTVVKEDTTFTYTCNWPFVPSDPQPPVTPDKPQSEPAPAVKVEGKIAGKVAGKVAGLAMTGATAGTAGLLALALAGTGLMLVRRRND